MNYFDVFLDEFHNRNQTAGDITLLNLFNKHYDALALHFNECVDFSIDACQDYDSKKYLSDDISYQFLTGLKNDFIIDKELDLIIWAIINYEQTNFIISLKKVSVAILNSIHQLEMIEDRFSC